MTLTRNINILILNNVWSDHSIYWKSFVFTFVRKTVFLECLTSVGDLEQYKCNIFIRSNKNDIENGRMKWVKFMNVKLWYHIFVPPPTGPIPIPKYDIYLLFPINIITMFELECWRASSSQVVRWLNVSRLWKDRKQK